MPRYQEAKDTTVAGLDVPPGWAALAGPGFHGITQEGAVRSAVATYNQVGNKPLSHNPFADTTLLTDPENISNWTPARPGVFNIAIYPDMDNHFLSSLNSNKGRVYPCEPPGPNPFVPGSEKNYDETKAWGEFVDLTLLSLSKDFKAQCFEYNRMRCLETGEDVRQYYTRTNKAHLTYDHVQSSFRNCHLPKGDRTAVGRTQCQKAKLDC